MFGFSAISGSSRKATVHVMTRTGNSDATPTDWRMSFGHGTNIDTSVSNSTHSGTAATWISFDGRRSSGTQLVFYTFAFDMTNKTLGGSGDGSSVAGVSGNINNYQIAAANNGVSNAIQQRADFGTTAQRQNLAGTSTFFMPASNFNSSDHGGTIYSPSAFGMTPQQFYGSTYRLNDEYGYYFSGNGANHGYYLFHWPSQTHGSVFNGTVAGADSGVNAGYSGPPNQEIYGLLNSQDESSPGLLGTSYGTTYSNLGSTSQVCWVASVNSFTGNGTILPEDTTTMYLNHLYWDKDNNQSYRNGSTVSKFTGGNTTYTLPTHTGSTYTNKILATTWGNVILHGDSATPSNSCVFPVTWSGSPTSPTSTVASSVSWPDKIGVDLTDCYWRNLDGIGQIGKNNCGQSHSGSIDKYRTFAFRHVGSNTEIDIIKVDFSNTSGFKAGTAKDSDIELLHKNVYTIVGKNLDVGVDVDPIFTEDDKDLLLWIRNTNPSDVTECRLLYIEDAYF
tara:strand:+ start:2766 stop:4280 length:1515 start_codon:yes stop_codon:yes gene_type:complete